MCQVRKQIAQTGVVKIRGALCDRTKVTKDKIMKLCGCGIAQMISTSNVQKNTAPVELAPPLTVVPELLPPLVPLD
jgi:hypothetical protein